VSEQRDSKARVCGAPYRGPLYSPSITACTQPEGHDGLHKAVVGSFTASWPDTPEVEERPEGCPTCGSDERNRCCAEDDDAGHPWEADSDCCDDPFHTTPPHPPVSSEEDRARGLDTRFIGLSVVAHTGDGPIQGVIVDYDDYAAEIRSGAMHERVTWPCLYWPKDEAREPAKWDDRGSACGGARPVSSEEDRSMVRRWHRIGLHDAPQIRAILTDATTLAQYAKERGE